MTSPDWLLGTDARVDHFRVLRPLGRGSTAEVYLARDESLGRKVALKLILPAFLGSEDAKERFLLEAKATAKFSHPHIVTIYAVGESEGRPYLALEYLEGESLRARLEGERPAVPETMRLGLAMAEALAEAHGAGVLHRDLKPENVIMAKDGRLRVLDFGLAGFRKTGGPAEESADGTTAAQGTPGYMAPEQWQGLATGGTADVWALGVILYELIAGRRPIEEASVLEQATRVCDPEPVPRLSESNDVRPDLADLIGRCLHKDPAERPTAAEVVQQLGQMLVVDRDVSPEEESPFRGLMTFGEQHRQFFFGREAEIAAAAERLRTQPVLPIVGASGAGKSSLVQAGLIPRLRERGPLVVLQTRPGGDPFRALAIRIAAARKQATRPDPTLDTSDADRLSRQLQASPTLLNVMLHRLAERRRATVLLFVDQLEELVTLVPDEDIRQGFMQAVCTAADDPEMPVRVVLTLREEFLSRLATGPGVREALGQVTVLRSPGPEALQEIVSEPVRLLGYDYDDPELPGEMVSEVHREASCLPLLQFAGSTLWQRRDKQARKLRRSVYTDMGGVVGALAQHADGLLAAMSANEVALARSIFLRLVTDEGTRRVQAREDLLDGLAAGAEHVLASLTEARLVTTRKSEDEGESQLELVHESLVVTWGRLARWIDESSEELRFMTEIGQAAELWAKRGHRAEEAWQGHTLHEAERAIQHCTTDVGTLIKRFLAASRRKERRRLWRRRGIVAAAFLMLTAIAVVFIVKEEETREQRDVAYMRQAQALRENARSALDDRHPLTARALLRESLELEDSAISRAIWWRLIREPLELRISGNLAAWSAISRDGSQIAASWQPFQVTLYDTRTGRPGSLLVHPDQVGGPHYAPDGKLVAAESWGGTVLLFRTDNGELVRRWRTTGTYKEIAPFSPSGSRLAAEDEDRSITILDVNTGEVVGTARKPPLESERSRAVNFEYGSFQFVGEDHILARDLYWERQDRARVGLFDIRSGQLDRELVRWDPGKERGRIVTIIRGADHGLFAIWSWGDGPTRLYDTRTGKLRHELPFGWRTNQWYGLAMEPDGKYLVFSNGGLGGLGPGVERWNLETGKRDGLYPVPCDFMDMSPVDGTVITSCGKDHVVLRPDRMQPEPHEFRLLNEASNAILAGRDGDRLVVLHRDGVLRSWDPKSRRLVDVLLLGKKRENLNRFELSPDGELIVTNDSPHILHARYGYPVVELEDGHLHFFRELSFLDNGKLVGSRAKGRPDSPIEYWIWNAENGRLVRKVPSGRRGFVSTSGMKQCLATASGDMEIRSLHTGKVEKVFPGLGFHASKGGGTTRAAEFSADGRYLVVFDRSSFWTFDLTDGQKREYRYTDFGWPAERARGFLSKYWVMPGGKRIAVVFSHVDEFFAVWDLEEKRVATGPVRVPRTSIGYQFKQTSRGGYFVFSAPAELPLPGVLRIYHAGNGRPVWHSPVFISDGPRLLTHEEWVELGSDKPADPALAGPSAWTAMLKEARLAREDSAGQSLCVIRWDGSVEQWDLATKIRTLSAQAEDAEDIEAAVSGCVTRSAAGTVNLWRSGYEGSIELVASGGLALSVDPLVIMVITKQSLLEFTHDGQALRETALDGGRASAVCKAGDKLIVGRDDGRIVVSHAKPGTAPVLLRDAPGFRVLRLLPGPMGTVIAANEDGTVGLWELSTGTLLHAERMYGSAVHLLLKDKKLYAASDLGDHLAWDLQYFYEDYCTLLRSVWDEVEVAVEGGNVVLRVPPEDHRCR